MTGCYLSIAYIFILCSDWHSTHNTTTYFADLSAEAPGGAPRRYLGVQNRNEVLQILLMPLQGAQI